jgi:DNA polymerase III subunit epsilon
MLPKKLAFVDLETTGASANHSRILEIGILRVENGAIVDTFSSLVNPLSYIPPEIERLTGIRQNDVENAPTFDALSKDIYAMLKDYIFVAHNVRFDYGFLKSEFARSEIAFTTKHFCTVRLSRLLYPNHRRHNLDSIIERFDISCSNRHRALDDAKVIQEFYTTAQKSFPAEKFEKAVSAALKKPSIPLRLKQEMLDALPEHPGVYIMYGSNGTPLYVGKSISIKERVLSHFAADIHSSSEMKIAQQIESIETITTPGELGALVLESAMIKKLLPLYNKKLRIKRELIVIKNKKNKDGYETVDIEPVEKIYPEDIQNDAEEKILGLFNSRRQAKSFLTGVAKEYKLCEKLLRLESTGGACFAYRLGSCGGACIGEELTLKYNMRFTEAFSDIKIKPWPFKGPIVIEEKNEISGEMQYFFIDKWCYLGSITADMKGSLNKIPEEDIIFDTDLYKILRSYLRTPRYLKNIKQLEDIQIDHLLQENTREIFL